MKKNRTDLERLRDFANDLWWEIDGMQELMLKHGLIEEFTAEAPCDELDPQCNCAYMGADFPTICYRRTKVLETPTEQPPTDEEELKRPRFWLKFVDVPKPSFILCKGCLADGHNITGVYYIDPKDARVANVTLDSNNRCEVIIIPIEMFERMKDNYEGTT